MAIIQPTRMAKPPHARLETHAPRATPKPMPTRGGGLGVFPLPTPKLPPRSLTW
ncbi:hypothetical protein Hanom_Chr02g00102511 [Helianthus anomalus]